MENADAWSTPQEYGVICKLLHPLSCKELMWIFWQSAAEAFPVLFLTPPKKKKQILSLLADRTGQIYWTEKMQ